MEKLLEIERLSEKQISKIQKELDFFKEKDYEVTDVYRTYLTNGNYYFRYLLEKEGFHKVECNYDVSLFGRVYKSYNIINWKDDFYHVENCKSFDNFINRYF